MEGAGVGDDISRSRESEECCWWWGACAGFSQIQKFIDSYSVPRTTQRAGVTWSHRAKGLRPGPEGSPVLGRPPVAAWPFAGCC